MGDLALGFHVDEIISFSIAIFLKYFLFEIQIKMSYFERILL